MSEAVFTPGTQITYAAETLENWDERLAKVEASLVAEHFPGYAAWIRVLRTELTTKGAVHE